jgi:hypothetical protein
MIANGMMELVNSNGRPFSSGCTVGEWRVIGHASAAIPGKFILICYSAGCC